MEFQHFYCELCTLIYSIIHKFNTIVKRAALILLINLCKEEKMEVFQEKQQVLCQEIIKLIRQEALLNNELIRKAERQANLKPGMTWVMFNEMSELVSFLENHLNEQMLERAEQSQSRRRQISALLLARLQILSPEGCMALGSYYLKHPILAQQNSWQVVNVIWQSAGDKSTDFNYYSKRALLFGVYKATILFYIGSKGDLEETSAFIQAQLDNIVKKGQKLNSLREHIPAFSLRDIPFIRYFS